MALNFKSQWAKLSPGRQRIIAVAAIVALVLGVIAMLQSEPTKESKYIAKRDKVTAVFSDSDTRNQTIDSLAGQIRNLRDDNEKLMRRLQQLEEKSDDQRFRDMETHFAEKQSKLREELNRVNAAVRDIRKNPPQPKAAEEGDDKDKEKAEREKKDANAVARANRERPNAVRTARDRRTDDSLKSGELPPPKNKAADKTDGPISFEVNHAADVRGKKDAERHLTELRLSVVSEAEPEKPAQKKGRNTAADSDAYIPAGSILTGTIMTGGDFPTNKGAFDNPTPLLIRLSKEAILPNRHRSDVRECFLLAGGAGDLASERAKLRGETLSCIRNDGSVIETKLESYVSGEDGKAGVKGRLVSKQGQVIARSLVAGFAGGMSDAFDVDPVPVLNTNSNGETVYQDALSGNMVRGAAVKGLSKSLDRIAQFYLDMAEDMFPVIEINAGRQVDVVVISGTSLRISAKGTLNTKKN